MKMYSLLYEFYSALINSHTGQMVFYVAWNNYDVKQQHKTLFMLPVRDVPQHQNRGTGA